jgi:hypothetical protein
MSDQNGSLRNRMIEIGLADPFIRVIVGMVAIATAASFVVSIIGDRTRAVLAVGLSLMFGVVLVVLLVLMCSTGLRLLRQQPVLAPPGTTSVE